MSGLVRRAGRFIDVSGRSTRWSVAEGRRGRRWRWALGDRHGGLVAAHTLECGPDGRFERLESAAGNGLLTLHREGDGSIHGNRTTDFGVDHLTIASPAPDLAIVGGAGIGVAAFLTGLLGRADLAGGHATIEVLEIFDDLGVRVAGCTIATGRAGEWELRTSLAVRTLVLGSDGLPSGEIGEGMSWALERLP